MIASSALQLERRRRALRAALYLGDPVLIARAAARVRLPGAAAEFRDMRRARDARHRLGRAIRLARVGSVEVVWPTAAAVDAARRRVSRRLLVAAAAAIALAVATLVGAPRPTAPAVDETASPTPLVGLGEPSGGASGASTISLGRVIAARSPVAVQQTPVPTASATPRRTTAPGSRTSASPGSGGTGSGGSGSGSGGGVAGATPGPLQPGFVRVEGFVYDADTRTPLSGVCIRLGFGCVPIPPSTDPNGLFIVDLPLGDGSIAWDLGFERDGYIPLHYALSPSPSRVRYLGILYLHHS